MFYFLSLISGILISAQVFLNGRLSQTYSIYFSNVIIHLVGLIAITVVVLFMRERPFAKMQKWYLYAGGAIGVMILSFNNIAFGRIGVSAIMALLLLGQSVAGLVVDQTGWMGMTKHPFRKHKLIGLAIIISGIAVMLMDRLDIIAVVTSLGAGVAIIIARTLNAKLAEATSVQCSTYFNYFIGIIFSIPVFFILSEQGAIVELSEFAFSPNAYIYFGGFLGMFFVMMNNVLVRKIPAFYLTLLIFVGQVFTGITFDTLIDGAFSIQILIGGVLVSAGLCVDLLLDRKKMAK